MWSIRSFRFQVSNTGTALLLDTNANTQIFSCLTWKVHPTSKSQVSVLLLQPLCWNSQVAYQWEDNEQPCSTNWKGAKKPLQFVSWVATCALYPCKAPDSLSHQAFISFQVSCSTCCHSNHMTTGSTQRNAAFYWHSHLLSSVAGGAVYAGVLVCFTLISRTRTNDVNFDISEKKLNYFCLCKQSE